MQASSMAKPENIVASTTAGSDRPAIPAKFEPRTAAPEKTHDLAAMREIANLSSRAAIATHHHQHGLNRAWTTLAVGAICLVLGLVLLCMSQAVFSMITLCGLAGLGAGGYFIYESRVAVAKLAIIEAPQAGAA